MSNPPSISQLQAQISFLANTVQGLAASLSTTPSTHSSQPQVNNTPQPSAYSNTNLTENTPVQATQTLMADQDSSHTLPPPGSASSSTQEFTSSGVAPITQPYQSLRPRQPQASSQSSLSVIPSSIIPSFQPFLGTSLLEPPLSTRNANHARRSHADSSIPRSPSLARRRPRPRGPAQHPPQLPRHSQASGVDCISTGDNGVQVLRLVAKIYPPPVRLSLIILSSHQTVS